MKQRFLKVLIFITILFTAGLSESEKTLTFSGYIVDLKFDTYIVIKSDYVNEKDVPVTIILYPEKMPDKHFKKEFILTHVTNPWVVKIRDILPKETILSNGSIKIVVGDSISFDKLNIQIAVEGINSLGYVVPGYPANKSPKPKGNSKDTETGKQLE